MSTFELAKGSETSELSKTGIVGKNDFVAGMSSTLMASSLAEDIVLVSGLAPGEQTISGLYGDWTSRSSVELHVALNHTETVGGWVDRPMFIEMHTVASEAEGKDEEDPDEPLVSDVYRLALAVAAERPAVDEALPEVPELTGNPVADVQALFALTAVELAGVLGLTERQVLRLKSQGVQDGPRRRRLDAIQAVGLDLIGGLGPDGAKRWLDAGQPTSWQLLSAGEVREVAARARALTDSPAT